jgi:predicted amidohydrolase YtcJ
VDEVFAAAKKLSWFVSVKAIVDAAVEGSLEGFEAVEESQEEFELETEKFEVVEDNKSC